MNEKKDSAGIVSSWGQTVPKMPGDSITQSRCWLCLGLAAIILFIVGGIAYLLG